MASKDGKIPTAHSHSATVDNDNDYDNEIKEDELTTKSKPEQNRLMGATIRINKGKCKGLEGVITERHKLRTVQLDVLPTQRIPIDLVEVLEYAEDYSEDEAEGDDEDMKYMKYTSAVVRVLAPHPSAGKIGVLENIFIKYWYITDNPSIYTAFPENKFDIVKYAIGDSVATDINESNNTIEKRGGTSQQPESYIQPTSATAEQDADIMSSHFGDVIATSNNITENITMTKDDTSRQVELDAQQQTVAPRHRQAKEKAVINILMGSNGLSLVEESFTLPKTKRKSFEDRIAALKAYKKRHGHLNVSQKEDRSLHSFCARMRTAKHYPEKTSNRLKNDRISALDAIGFNWMPSEQRLEAIEANKNAARHGNGNVRAKRKKSPPPSQQPPKKSLKRSMSTEQQRSIAEKLRREARQRTPVTVAQVEMNEKQRNESKRLLTCFLSGMDDDGVDDNSVAEEIHDYETTAVCMDRFQHNPNNYSAPYHYTPYHYSAPPLQKKSRKNS